MRIPLSWLQEFVPVDLPLDELTEVMGRNGLEVEEVRRPGAGVTGVVVARVLDVADHPNADKLAVVTVDDGGGERTVLAGARNMEPGDLVPLAVPGARLPTEEGPFEISRREMRGITSDGMLCSPLELGISDDHGGILVFGAGGWRPEVEAGADVHDVLPLGEPVINVAVPADRGDLHSVLGVARDLAAILDLEVATPQVGRSAVDAPAGRVPVSIDAAEGCSRYVAWVVDGLTIGPSPWWLRRRLEACGIRSLTNLVDVTNYVMLELGQPLHAFDVAALHGPEIGVRWAQPGEPLTTLDGRDRALQSRDLVIVDADRTVALAGVMGGEDTEVTVDTDRVLIEAAAFDSAAVRRTSRRLGLVSEASIRFERGVDPAGVDRAAARAVDLLVDLADGTDAGVQVAGEEVPQRPAVSLDPRWTGRFLGVGEISVDRQAALLRRSGSDVLEADQQRLELRPPTWRTDLQRPADVVEEIARLYGYEKIPATLPPVSIHGGLTHRQAAERGVRRAVRALGFHEAQTTSFVGDDAMFLLAPEDDRRVRLQNPLAKDTATMRPGLVEGLLAAARRNLGQGRPGLALFEIGRIFRARGGPLDAVDGARRWTWEDPDGGPLPSQPVALGLVAYGGRVGDRWLDRDDVWDLYDLLAVADEVVRRLAPQAATACDSSSDSGSRPESARLERVPVERPHLHPGRTAALRRDGEEVGVVGQLHPDAADSRDLPQSTVVGELLLDPLWAHLDEGRLPARQAGSLARHPAVNVDVAVVAPEEVSYDKIEEAVRVGAGEVLDGLWWFDEYRGQQLGEGRRSLAFQLRLQTPGRQLTDEDAETAIDRIAAAVDDVGGSLRR